MKRRELAQGLVAMLAAAGSGSLEAAEGSDPNEWLPPGSITDVPGIKVGHFTLKTRPTGCTVIFCEAGAVAGVRWNHLPPKVRADIRQRVKAVRA